MHCKQCRGVFRVIGEGLNAQVDTPELLERVAKSLVEQFGLRACHFRLLSQDQRILESVASHGLSEKFLNKGMIDAERSVAEALAGRVVKVDDCSTDPRIQYPLECAEEGLVSLMTVPLATRGNVIGVMRLFTGEPREFSEEEVELFRVVGVFCSSAVIHSMFHRILDHVTQSIRASLDLPTVLESIARVVTEDLRAKGCTIRLFDPRGKRLEVRAAYGLSGRYLDRTANDPGSGVHEALRGQLVSILDARRDPRIRNVEEVIAERIASILFVPLSCGGTTLGVLSFYTHRPYEFSEEEKQLMMAIGDQCALAIRNAQMYDTIKRRYENVVDDFQQWFEAYRVYPTGGSV